MSYFTSLVRLSAPEMSFSQDGVVVDASHEASGPTRMQERDRCVV